MENSKSISNRHRIDEQIELIDQRVLNQRGNECRATVNDNIFAGRLLELADGVLQVTILHAYVLPIDSVKSFTEDDLLQVHHLASEWVLRAFRFGDFVFPVLDEARTHFSTQ